MSNVRTNVSAGNTKLNLGVKNTSSNVNNIANVAQRRPGVQTMPIAIPTGRNAAPPSPQLFVPMAINPGPITYPMSGDVQGILNQPAATMLDGPPDLSQYVAPVYSPTLPPTMPPALVSPQPSLSPQETAALIAAMTAVPAATVELVWYKDPKYMVPGLLALLVIAVLLWWWKRGKAPVARANNARFGTVRPMSLGVQNARVAIPNMRTVPRRLNVA